MGLILSPAQCRIIEEINHNLIVRSLARTGKTTTLLHKVAHLIKTLTKRPKDILVLIPMWKSENEFREQLNEIVGKKSEQVSIKTMHEFCCDICFSYADELGIKPNVITYNDDAQTQIILHHLIDELQIKKPTLSPCQLRQSIQTLKQNRIQAADLKAQPESMLYDDLLCKVYHAYETYLLHHGVLDKEDFPILVETLFKEHPKHRENIAKKTPYLLIDNYEDMTYSQQHCLMAFAPDVCHLTVFSDIDQTIQIFREGEHNHLSFLQKKLPRSKAMDLKTYYGKNSSIFDAKKSLINELVPIPKTMTEKQAQREDPITYFVGYDEQEEMEFITQKIQELTKEKNISFSDIGIVYRTDKQRHLCEEYLSKLKIPFSIMNDNGLYHHMEIRTILSYLRLIYNGEDEQALLSLLKVPMFNVKGRDIKSLLSHVEQQKTTVYDLYHQGGLPKLTRSMKGALDQVFTNREQLLRSYETKSLTLADLVNQVLKDTGFKQYLSSLGKEKARHRFQLIQDLCQRFIEDPQDLRTLFTKKMMLPSYFNDTGLMDISGASSKQDAVSLIPLEQCKGRQVKVIFVSGVEEGIIPHYSSQFNHQSMDLERYYFYIALDCAEDLAFITSIQNRSERGKVWHNDLSRFITDIPRSSLACFVSEKTTDFGQAFLRTLEEATIPYLSRQNKEGGDIFSPSAESGKGFSVGDKIVHSKFGEGVVQRITTQSDDVVLTIAFESGIRQMMAKYAGLVKG